MPAAGAAVDVAAVRAAVKERLPASMVPAVVLSLDRLPLTANGKVDRAALPEPDTADESDKEAVAPRTAVEAELARIWAEVLGRERVGVHDNFFELGGDSILSIQIVARANRVGVTLKPKHLFQHQTIAELASVVALERSATADLRPVSEIVPLTPVTGAVPLSPVQHWFLDPDPVDAHHFNQALMLTLRAAADPALVEQAVAAIYSHHDVLRARFVKCEGSWRQEIAPFDGSSPFSEIDLSPLSEDLQPSALSAACADVQASLDLASGPIFKVVLFTLGRARGQRLLLVAHHLVIDGVSWRLLVDDLRSVYERIRRGEGVELPAKSTSWRQWSEYLSGHALDWEGECNYWASEARRQVPALRTDQGTSPAMNSAAGVSSVAVSLNRTQTQALLHSGPTALRARIDEILIAAAARALRRWSGSSRLLIDIEGHGRSEGVDQFDLSRTVGWFTTIFPVLFDLPFDDSIDVTLKTVKEQLREVPADGIGYGVLRYLGSASTQRRLSELPRSEVSFNYLGQFDQLLPEAAAFQLAPEPTGPAQSPRARRRHLIEITGLVLDGELRVEWRYSPGAHRRASIEQLASSFIGSLREAIDYSNEPGLRALTLSDFPLASVGQEALEHLAAQYPDMQDVYPVTATQHGMLFHYLLNPDDSLYCELFTYRLTGALDIDALKDAWRRIIERHEILRSVFVWQGVQEPVQVVRRHLDPSWVVHDWRAATADEQGVQLGELLAREERQRFDLALGPLMRMTVVRLADGEAQFVLAFQHVLLDGWSLAIVLRDVGELYEAARAGRTCTLAPTSAYGTYIGWLRQKDHSQTRAYWRAVLGDFSSPTPLGIDRPAGGPPSSREQTVRVSEESTAELRQWARSHKITLNTLLLGVWAYVLSRYSGEEDVVFGETVSGRPPDLPGAASIMGLFINTVPFRVRVPRSQTVVTWLRDLQDAQLAQGEHQHLPLVEITRCSGVGPDVPLFESMFVLENYPVDRVPAESGQTLIGHSAEARHRSNYPLALVASPGRHQLLLRAIYDGRRFDDEVITRLLEHVKTVIEAVAKGPNQRVGDLALLTAGERRELVETRNATKVGYPAAALGELFEAQVRARPGVVAVECGAVRLSYAEVNRRANQVAHALRRAGVGLETRVGVWGERSVELVVALVGIVKAGGAYVALDPASPVARLAGVVADAGLEVVVTAGAALPAGLSGLRVVEVGATGGEAATELGVAVPAEALAYVAFTSGSTGRPKGVEVPQRGVVRLLFGVDYVALGPAETLLQLAPVAFDASTLEIWGALLHGGRLVIYPERVPEPAALGAVLRGTGVTTLWLTASLYNAVVEQAPEALRGVRQLLVGGEALSVAHVRRGLAQLPRTTLINGYGPTEATTFTCCYRIPRDVADEARSIPIGEPIGNTRVYVLDDGLEPAPVGVPGELYVGGDGLARGYAAAAALTAEKFVPDGMSGAAGARLYRTGDLVRWRTDGVLEFLGLRDRQVKLRGHRIELGEIEAALRTQAAVQDAVVEVRGEGAAGRLVAYVVWERQESWEVLRAHLREQLPDYMVPGAFVALEQVPLTANGKVDRAALPDADGERQLERRYVAPQTETEHRVAEIWQQVLRLERVGTQDDFFELGGHSLLAMQVISRLRERLHIELPLASLFENPTVAGVAAEVDRRGWTELDRGTPPLVHSPRDGELPLSFAQQRLWFLDRLEPGSASYNVPAAIRLDGPLDTRALERTFEEIVRRHEVLRTTFETTDGHPVQVIAEPSGFKISLIDLRGLSEDDREREVMRLATAEAYRPFDLARGPLLRVTLMDLAEEEHVLLLVLHHVVCDAWSLGILVREWVACYEAFATGTTPSLEPLPLQYADFARWQCEWLKGSILEEQLAYWKRQLANLPPLNLPTDRPRPSIQTFNGGWYKFRLPKNLSDSLTELGRQEGATMFMTVLSVFKVLLSRYTGQRDIVVGTPIANRNRMEIEGLIGFFTNTLVMRTDLSGNPTCRELLQRLRHVALDAYAHQDLPFEKLVEELQPERELTRNPLFQVLFAVQNAPMDPLALPRLGLRPLDLERIKTRFDLELHVGETDEGLTAAFCYNTDLFDAPTIVRMAGHLRVLLESFTLDPQQPIAELPMLPQAERQQLLEWNATAGAYPRSLTVQEMFETQVVRTPDAVAVEFHSRQLTYFQLNSLANQLAHHLRSLGVRPDDRVAICLERSIGMVVGVLGILKAGGAYVPLDPAYPTERLVLMLKNSQARVLLTEEDLLCRFRSLVRPRARATRTGRRRPTRKPLAVLLDRDWASITNHEESNPSREATADNLAYVLYTSGSTGRPKGVAMRHQGLVNLLCW